MAISYGTYPNCLAAPCTTVFINSTLEGYIESSDEGYYYQTKDYKYQGEVFATEAEVKSELEAAFK